MLTAFWAQGLRRGPALFPCFLRAVAFQAAVAAVSHACVPSQSCSVEHSMTFVTSQVMPKRQRETLAADNGECSWPSSSGHGGASLEGASRPVATAPPAGPSDLSETMSWCKRFWQTLDWLQP
eukprot:10433952-Alexandrium_andersonii.AAC.1